MNVAQTILEQIRYGAIPARNGAKACNGMYAMMCWGFNSAANIGNGLAFKVKGRHVRGTVKVELTSDDLYDITFLNVRGRELNKVEGVFFDQLADIIDYEVESK